MVGIEVGNPRGGLTEQREMDFEQREMDFLTHLTLSRSRRVVVCVAMLVCILSTVLLPQIDLMPTTLRAQRTASLLIGAALAIATLFFRLPADLWLSELALSFNTPSREVLPPHFSITCELLC
jgi:hypothetical protein